MKDLSIAISYAELSFDELETMARQGDAEAQFHLALRYDIDDDYKEAAKWYAKGAQSGDATAQFSLAQCYYYGKGVKKDPALAVEWYIKSACQGCLQAQNNLGDCYENGVGVAKDISRAIYWYTEAAQQGDELAKENLEELTRKQDEGSDGFRQSSA